MPMQLEGLESLRRQMQQMEKRTQTETTEKALKAGGNVFKEDAERGIRAQNLIKSSNWLDNIIVSDVKNGEVEIGADAKAKVFYDHFHEFGTSKMPAHPVYGPAYQNNKEQAQTEMAKVIRRELGL